MLEALEKAAYEAEAQELRRALKTWETEWSREHDGRKPGRDDIKRHGAIAQKYTAYNRVRSILAGGGKPDAGRHAKKHGDDNNNNNNSAGTSSQRKRKSTDAGAFQDSTAAPLQQQQQQQTPSKRPRTVGATPRKNASRPTTTTMTTPARTPMGSAGRVGGGGGSAAFLVTPSISRRLFSPVAPTSIGPTPQRDGRVLGLFDVLAEDEDDNDNDNDNNDDKGENGARTAETPLRRRTRDAAGAALGTTPLQVRDANAAGVSRFLATPSKRPPQLPASSSPACSFLPPRSPAQVSLALLPPPSPSPRHGDNDDDDAAQFATPAFLRRTSSVLVAPVPSKIGGGGGLVNDENSGSGMFASPPRRLQLPGRKPLVRGLSSVLKSLRQAEDARLDEELDLLRDLEDGDAPRAPAVAAAAAAAAAASKPTSKPTTEVLDSQVAEEGGPHHLLGGFDDEGLYDSPPEDAGHNRDGQPLRVYKKKGQKRTTRLARMRPTRTRRPEAETEAAAADEEEEEEEEGEEGEEEAVPETQGDKTQAGDGAEEDDESDYEDDKKAKAAPKAKKSGKSGKSKKEATTETDKDKDTAGPVRKTARKVNELAHANFKRLKLRNKGTKGGPGFGSRFRRRR